MKSKKNLGQSGFMEYFKVTGRKDVEEDRESNVEVYKYYNDPDGYPTYDSYDMADSYRYYSETTDSKGLTIKHSFNSSHKQDESTTIRESYILDEEGRNVEEEKFYSNDKLEMSKRFQYDGSGNLKTEKIQQSPGV